MKEELIEVEIGCIRVNPYQPRRFFNQEELEDLAASIQNVGLIHPPSARPLENGLYEIISGERRFRASQLAGLKRIPLLVKREAAAFSAQAALIENIQRVDLNPIEIAKALKSLINEFGYHQEELAQRIGKKRSTIANYLRLLSLPKKIQEGVASGEISMGHAKAILSLEELDQQIYLYELTVRDGLNVRDTEEAANRISQKVKKQRIPYVNRDFILEHLEEKIRQALGTKATIQGNQKKGRICVDYYNLDDLDRLLEIFGVK